MAVYPLSSIVIDEIQAYDPEMAAIIIKTLKMIKEVQGNILVITATFPPYFEEFLVNGKLDLNFTKVDLKKEKNEISQKIKNYDVNRHRIELIDCELFEKKKEENREQLKVKNINKVKEIIESPEHVDHNVLIIVNNVMKAIKLFETLEKEYDHQKIWLLHSRLLEKEKDRRINEIKDFLDKKFKKEIPPNERVIVVSTQLVEASVDFDFDVLITEISPIDSQIQRWGRIYRNRDGEGDYKEDAPPNIYIFTEIDDGTKAIYRPLEVLEKTLEVLRAKEHKVLGYEDERSLIDEVYNAEEIKEKYEREIDKTLEWLDYYQASKKSEAQRIFRRIAGTQVVIPQIMEMEDNKDGEYLRRLAMILKHPEDIDKSWEEICKNIYGNLANENTRFDLLRWLYEYSIPVPEYLLRRYSRGIVREFKGFNILDIEKEEAEKVKKYGLDILINQDIDEYLERFITT